jgi:hypothetical protein
MALQLDAGQITVADNEIVPGGDPETTYTLRLLTRDDYRRVVREHTTKVPNRRSHAMEDVTNWEAVGERLLDMVLTGWTGILHGGEPAPCTAEMKAKLDSARSAGLLDRAGMNQIARSAEAKADSFRGAP